MRINCGTCHFCVEGVCQNNLSDNFKLRVNAGSVCKYMKRLAEQNIIIRDGNFSPNEISLYVSHLKQKYPDTQFGTITLDEDGDHVLITYEVFPDNVERIRKLPDNLD